MRQKWIKEMAVLAFGLIAALAVSVTFAGAATVETPSNFQATMNSTANPAVAANSAAVKNEVTLTWNYKGTPSSFTIESADFKSGLVKHSVAGSARSYTLTGLPRGLNSHYRIMAHTSSGPSAWSSVVTVSEK